MAITGTTRLYAIMGDPVAQVRAPMVFNPLLAAAGIDACMVALRVEPAHLAEALAGLRRIANLGGLIVTVPHKMAILPLLADLGPEARRAGAVNVVKPRPDGGWIGEMVDGVGFADGVKAAGHDVAGRRILLVGAGGAGSAIAFPLVDRGARELAIYDVDAVRAAALAERVRAAGGTAQAAARPDPAGFDIAINASPIGMAADDPLPFDPDRLAPGAVVAEVIMKPRETRLIAEARRRGHPVVLGERMLDYQAPAVARFFGWSGSFEPS